MVVRKLSKNGYIIRKGDYSTKNIKEIKEELFVRPHTFNKNANKESGFHVYMESPKKLYLPRYYGIKKYGDPTEDTIKEGSDINIMFKGGLREEQKPIEELYLKNCII